MQRQRRIGNDDDIGFECFPDDLVIQILCLVPAEQLWWRCRQVCKKWNALISSPSFAQTHLRQSPPTFLVFYILDTKFLNKMDFFLPDGDNEEEATLFIRRAFNGSLVKRWEQQTKFWVQATAPFASCNGLIFIETFMYFRAIEFYIGNLITGELLTVKHPYTTGFFCGFFYQSSSKEYKLLHCHRTERVKNSLECEYTLLTLGSTQWRSLGTLPYGVRYRSSPVILEDTLYWMPEDMNLNTPHIPCENFITTFSIHSEEFHTMCHPNIECEPSECHWRLRLLEMDGRLTCWYLSGQVVHAWVYEVPSNWTMIYCLDSSRNFGRYYSPGDQPRNSYNIRPVRIQNQKLTLVWTRIGVLCYDLLKNTVQKIELEGIEQFFYQEDDPAVACYTKSLISLRNLYPGLSEIVSIVPDSLTD